LKSVTLYVLPACPYCEHAKQYLTTHAIPYREVVVTSEHALTELHSLGSDSVPTLVVENKVMRGFNENRLKRWLELT